MAEPKDVKFQREGKPGEWEDGTLASKPETHHEVLNTHTRADVRDDDGLIQKDVTIIPPDKE